MCEKINCIELFHYKKSDETLKSLTNSLLFRMSYVDENEKEFILNLLCDQLGIEKKIILQMSCEYTKKHQKLMEKINAGEDIS